MKKKTFGGLALSALSAFCAIASAQTLPSVTLYGLIDVAVERVSNVGASGTSLVRVPGNTGSLPSRWGMRGSEDLGDGLKAEFTLESGFGPDTGSLGQGGRLFGRQAYVGISGKWGMVSLGRQHTMLQTALMDADVIGPMLFSLGSLDNYIPNARADNALAWRGTFDGLTLGATYSLGRDTANPAPNNPGGTNCAGESATDTQACREWSLLAKYNQPSWGVAAGIDEMRGGAGSWVAAGLTTSSLTDRRSTLNGYVKVGTVKLAGGLISRNNEGSAATPRSDLIFFGVSYPVTPSLTLDAQLAQLKFKNSANKAQLALVRGVYSLSRRTALYASLGHISNDGTLAISVSGGASGSNPAAGASQLGILASCRVV
ncbi:MAG: porin, partial [Pseudomonadota bacterium]